MAGNGNTVTLTFAGDSSRLDRTFNDVQRGANQTNVALEKSGQGFKEVGVQARATKEILRGTGDVAMVMGSEFGGATTSAILLAGGIADLGRGLAHTKPALLEYVKGLGLLRIAGVTAGAAIGLLGLKMEGGLTSMNTYKKAGADINLALATNVHFVTQGIPLIGNLTEKWRSSADSMSQSAHNLANSWDLDTAALARLTKAHEASLFQAPDTNPGGDATFTALDAQNIATQSFADQSGATWDAYSASISKGGGGAASASNKAAEAMKATLSKWQSIADNYSSIAKSIGDSLGPKLEAALGNTLILGGASGGIVASLRKQLADTLHLKRDLAALAKAGLDPALLGQLAQGGLASLPAADELLGGGAGGISTVNGLAAGINAAGGSIAGAEAAREIANQQKTVKLNVNITGTQGDFEKLLRKMFKTQGPESFGLKAA